MNCPNCPEERLLMSERNGVEIDYCPKCRGVWLDRGELDKLLEKATELATADAPLRMPAPAAPVAVAPSPQPRDERRYDEPRYAERKPYKEQKEYKRYDDDDDYYKRKKKKSMLSELFDF